MNEIFLIVEHSSDYDSFPVPIGYTETEELAIEKVAHLIKVNNEVKSLRDQIYEYKKNVIVPSIPKLELEIAPDYPRWKEGIHQSEITEEMRNERNTIKELQNDIRERNTVRSNMWHNLVNTMRSDYISSLNLDPEVLLGVNSDSHGVQGYDYEKIEKL
jgi:hypothetical protein